MSLRTHAAAVPVQLARGSVHFNVTDVHDVRAVAFEVETIARLQILLIRIAVTGGIHDYAVFAVAQLRVGIGANINAAGCANRVAHRAGTIAESLLSGISRSVIGLAEEILSISAVGIGVLSRTGFHVIHGLAPHFVRCHHFCLQSNRLPSKEQPAFIGNDP